MGTRLLVALSLALFTGCRSIHEFEAREDLKPTEAIVVGRVRAKLFGKPYATWGDEGASFKLAFKEKQTLALEEYEIPADGLFALRVPAGTYGVYSELVYWGRG